MYETWIHISARTGCLLLTIRNAVSPNSPNGQRPGCGGHWPTPIQRQKVPDFGETCEDAGALGVPKMVRKVPHVSVVASGECFGQLWPNGPQPKVGPGRSAHNQEEPSCLRVVHPLSNNTVCFPALVLKKLADVCWLGYGQLWPNHLWPNPSLAKHLRPNPSLAKHLWPEPSLAKTKFGQTKFGQTNHFLPKLTRKSVSMF